ncbi:SRPBCC domain-containing protein [Actinacidiphila rubida]|uniref:Uncharacterized conserved protein YndB, AHSA1/START domain n=1 Tax=Actinacidiphila rubida TaxID=310780 RepID=A0A1H8LM25_9ACTN|nr:SRPBCC domain-containing protein [Actinacidiphila rubida]SEO06214.1 Uncharacterized conserved protein YndB, AHSA1/START domain [Actinacidiphila rubida]
MEDVHARRDESRTAEEATVMEDRIVQDITIDAGLERVWDLVTEPGWWVPTDHEVVPDRTPGHQTVRESAKYGRFPVEVVKLDPRTYAAFRWASQFPGEELAPGRTTLVEFAVEELPAGVRVTVTESGFASVEASDEVRTQGFNANTEGWKLELGSLRTRAETA